jgi:hypothetical protein
VKSVDIPRLPREIILKASDLHGPMICGGVVIESAYARLMSEPLRQESAVAHERAAFAESAVAPERADKIEFVTATSERRTKQEKRK